MPPKRTKGSGVPTASRGPPKPAAGAAAAAAVKQPRKKAKAYGMASVLPPGEILKDVHQQWKLGVPFASGGFGRIYDATPMDPTKLPKSCRKGQKFAIKIEPRSNGPLYQEMHVYMGLCKPDVIEKWKKSKGLSFLGVPEYIGSGVHTSASGEDYRFLVLEKFGKDLESLRVKQNTLPPSLVFALSKCCIDALHYIHQQDYVHADLKAENLLTEYGSDDFTRMVLTDFGLAKRVTHSQVYKEDPKQAHNGTLVFTSLDAHRGCKPSFRADVEILAYSIVYWLSGDLPWYKFEADPERVFKEKLAFSKNIDKQLKGMVDSIFVDPLYTLFKIIYGTAYVAKPDYNKLTQCITTLSKAAATFSVAKKGKKETPKRLNTGRTKSKSKFGDTSSDESENDTMPHTSSSRTPINGSATTKTPPKLTTPATVSGVRRSPRLLHCDASETGPTVSNRKRKSRSASTNASSDAALLNPKTSATAVSGRRRSPRRHLDVPASESRATTSRRRASRSVSASSVASRNSKMNGTYDDGASSDSSSGLVPRTPTPQMSRKVARPKIATKPASKSIAASVTSNIIPGKANLEGAKRVVAGYRKRRSMHHSRGSIALVVPGVTNMRGGVAAVKKKKATKTPCTMATQTSPTMWS